MIQAAATVKLMDMEKITSLKIEIRIRGIIEQK